MLRNGLPLIALALATLVTIFTSWGAIRFIQKLFFLQQDLIHVPSGMFRLFVVGATIALGLSAMSFRITLKIIKICSAIVFFMCLISSLTVLTLYLLGAIVPD